MTKIGTYLWHHDINDKINVGEATVIQRQRWLYEINEVIHLLDIVRVNKHLFMHSLTK